MKKRYSFLLFIWLTLANSEPSRRQHPHYIFWKHNPLFPLDNLWAKLIPSPAEINPYYISPHIPQEPPNYFNMYPHFPESTQPEKAETTSTRNEDMLIDSLNSALEKLHQLLPSELTTEKTSSGEEYATYNHQNTVHPEILAESVNKAIDTLTEVLSKVPKKHPPSVENLIIDPVVPGSELSQTMSLSVETAIQKLDELFRELPEELKSHPTPNHQQNADQMLQNVITASNVQLVVRPSESSGAQPFSSSVSASTESSLSLFTSKIEEFLSKISTTKTIEATTAKVDKESVTTTPTPPIKTAEEEFTSAVMVTGKTVTDVAGTTQDSLLSTSATVIVSSQSATEVPMTTFKPSEETATDPSFIDVRIGVRARSDADAIFFPDDDDEKVSDTLAPSNIHDLNIPLRFRETTSSSTTARPLSLQYQPIAPNPYPALPAQNPLLVVSNNAEDYLLGNRFQDTTTQKPQQNTPISLEFKPIRPFFAGPVRYPEPVISSGTPWPASSTQRYSTNELADRFQQTATTPPLRATRKPQQNTPISLEYKPMRPFFAGAVTYPKPIISSGTPWPASSTKRYSNELADRFQQTTTTPPPRRSENLQENTPISLEYKPMRPFHAGAVTYPKPIISSGTPWPASSTERYSNELADRFQQTTTTPPPRRSENHQENTPISLEYKPMRPFFAGPVTYPQPIVSPGTQWPASSTERYPPTDLVDRFQQQTTTKKPQANTPISLEYKPSRPFFAPDPIVYPGPIIPPGTPWPASSTERYPQTTFTNDLGNRFDEKTTTPRPNQNANTPLVLDYKPTRSPFLPDPWIYPSPIIPSGTPWPASSTERL